MRNFTLRANNGVCISVFRNLEGLNLNPAKGQLALGVELDIEALCAQKGLNKFQLFEEFFSQTWPHLVSSGADTSGWVPLVKLR